MQYRLLQKSYVASRSVWKSFVKISSQIHVNVMLMFPLAKVKLPNQPNIPNGCLVLAKVKTLMIGLLFGYISPSLFVKLNQDDYK